MTFEETMPEVDDLGEDPSMHDDMGSLISFANLENLMKHIIRKFKVIEARDIQTSNAIATIQNELQMRSLQETVDEMNADIAARIDIIKSTVMEWKDMLNSMEIQVERNRGLTALIEKKLDASIQEKAVQDRLLRETQDALQDKVSIAELNMFEAKFAGYTTKLEHQEVLNALSHYTQLDVTERIAESVKSLTARFDDYARTAKVDRMIQDLKDWVSEELSHYARLRQTAEKMDHLEMQIRDQSMGFERTHAAADDRIRGISDRITSIYNELNEDLQQRALADELRELQQGMRKYALRSETEAFRNDSIPKLRFCVDSIKAFDDRLRAQDGAIQRVDEVLLDKACKYDIIVLNSRVDRCLQEETGMREIQNTGQKLEWLNKRFQEYVELEQKRFDAAKPPDYENVIEDLTLRVSQKADKADLAEMYQLKANRAETDDLIKLQDQIQRQLEYLAVTTFGLSKLSLTEAKVGESKTLRTQQKAQVLMQSEALWHWILHNDPPPNLDSLRPPAQGTAKAGSSMSSPTSYWAASAGLG